MLPFTENVGKDFIRLPENTSFYRNPTVAINHAFSNCDPAHIPVLFIIACQNYQSPLGMSLKSEAYSAYPSEREYLLIEGSDLWVLAVEKDITIENYHESYSMCAGKNVTVIHMY